MNNGENEVVMSDVTAVSDEKKVDSGSSYSAKEQKLIQQLVQVRLDKKSKLEYESLDDYVVPPRTHFSMLKKPAVSIKRGKMQFNMACIRLFEGIKHILPIISESKQRLAVLMCAEEEISSVEWARIKKNAWVNKPITSLEFVENIFNMMEWNTKCRYKVLGRIAQSQRGLILLFDLSEAIMFDPVPEEYIDKQTGEVKKRTNKYFPDKYDGRIGRLYSDYETAQQLSLFESLSSYSDTEGTEIRSSVTEEEASLISAEVREQKMTGMISTMLEEKEDGSNNN